LALVSEGKTYSIQKPLTFSVRIKEYLILGKHRLSLTVVISAFLGYLLAGKIVLNEVLLLTGGGFLLTLSSNAFNQVWEREFDKLMQRTQNRPLVKGSLSILECLIFAIVTGASGLVLLLMLNQLTFIMGLLSIFLYVFIYTPMKRLSPWAVFVGALPGAMPPLMGYVASTGDFGLVPGVLFLVQFMWQFPHFWAIAWVLDDDYKKAGYRLLPSKFGKNKTSSFQIVAYTIGCVITSFAPYIIGTTGTISAMAAAILGAIFLKYAFVLHSTNDVKDARKLMFASFIYLPLLQIFYVIDFYIL
jgi:protoheme IX farnesyltransferase